MKTVNVDLGVRSYPIHIGSGLLTDTGLYAPHIKGSDAVIVTSESVAPLYLHKVESAVQDLAQVIRCVLPDGEQNKTLATVERIIDDMIGIPCSRHTTVIALGGGVVGDITGFAAACYQRGVPLIQVPTTLLAQVDSSVGGKTGVNHRLGKNMIGAFKQPRCVIADSDTLETLPAREVRAGVAEIIKYGAIRDTSLFDWLETGIEDLINLDQQSVAHAVERSCINKAEVVALDELESGMRAILNFGHTFGHAIETATRYGQWLHGEAIATGMIMAADFSNRMGLLGSDDVDRIESVVRRAGLPSSPPRGISPESFVELMQVDKKVIHHAIRIIALTEIGNAVIVGEDHMDALRDTLRARLSPA